MAPSDETATTPPTPGAEQQHGTCKYPGCTRPSREDPRTGRPSLYCEQADPDGPIHNKGNAWKQRHRDRATHTKATPVTALAEATNPVSMAKATLEQQLAQLPTRLSELRDYFDQMRATLTTAGDLEAAAAEVDEAHHQALAQIAEAERLRASAERARRAAEDRAQTAEQERAEADAAADEALTNLARTQAQTAAEIQRITSEVQAAIQRAQASEQQAREETEWIRTEAATQVQAARAEAATQINAARQDAAEAHTARTRAETEKDAAQRAAAEDRATLTQLRNDLEQARRQHHEELHALRQEARADREQLRTDHAEQLQDLRHATEDRVSALTRALEVAQAATENSRAQRTERTGPVGDPAQGSAPTQAAGPPQRASSTTPRQP